MASWLISTDLDGTLLNHTTYDYTGIVPLLAQLKVRGVPVILNSSKTLAELTKWRQVLSLTWPVIGENGGVIQTRRQPPILIGRPINEIRAFLNRWREQNGWQFEGFGDWSLEQVIQQTGLSQQDAQNALQREVTEPILWLGEPPGLELFEQALAQQGLQLQKGGRFYHVMAQHSKASTLNTLLKNEFHYLAHQANWRLLSLGDGANDRVMLEMADVAVVMPDVNGQYLTLNSNNQIYQAQESAPQGWIEAVNRWVLKEAE